MCGIAGFSLADETRQVDATTLTRALLLGIEHRGRDATGVAWHGTTPADLGEVWIHKHNVRASEFVGALDLHGARAAIGHTRFATKGAPESRENNHPVEHDGIVLTHNGVVYNDDEVFDGLGSPERYGQVDSEAAAALIAHAAEALDAPFYECLSFLEGSAALAWLNVNDEPGTLHLARVASSPLVVAQTARGSLLYASTREAILTAANKNGFRVRYVNDLPEGSYLRVVNGEIVEVRRFAKPERTAPARKRYYDNHGNRITTRKRQNPSLPSTYGWLNAGMGS
jgi:glucosamine 6-phosphate synthetase-like amidotransferase/phosphosugar isomerase protein